MKSRSLALFFPLVVSLFAQGPPPGRGPGGKGPDDGGKWSVKPDTIYFVKTGNETTLTRTVNVKRNGPPGGPAISVAVQVTSVSGGNWLAAGTLANEKLPLTATPGSLGPGLYEAKVTITPSGSTPVTVRCFLLIGGALGVPSGGAFVRPSSLHFKMKQGAANPEPRILSVSSPTGVVSFAWSATRTIATPPGGNWLQIGNAISGGSAGQITVTANGTGLGVGVYTGKVTVTSGSSTVDVPVTFEVESPAQGEDSRLLVVAPKALNFIVHPGAPPPGPKTVEVKTTRGTPVNWTAMVESDGGFLLAPSPAAGSTPGTIQVNVNASGKPNGHYEGKLKVTSGGVTETVKVFLRVVGRPNDAPGVARPTGRTSSAVKVSPPVLQFYSGVTAAPVTSGFVILESRTGGLSFTATATTARGGPWLNLLTPAGPIPGAANVSVNAMGLGAGVYTGLITFQITGSVTERRYVLVILRVAPLAEAARLRVRPGGVVFQARLGGSNPAPGQVQLQVDGAAGAAYQTNIQYVNGSGWLGVTPAAGPAPATITVTPNISGLAAGVYQAAVVFQATGSPGALPATLNVALAVSAGGLSLSVDDAGQAAGPLGWFLEPARDFLAPQWPAAVQVAVFYRDGRPAEGMQIKIVSSGDEPPLWLDETGGGLYAGVFRPLSGGRLSLAGVAIDPAGATVSQFSLGGDIEGADETTPVIFQEGIVNTASFAPGGTPVAPGSIVSLFGRDLAESTALAAGTPLPRELAGVRVLAGGIEAPLVAVVAGADFDQINFQVPLELAGATHADVVVLSNGRYSGAEGLTLAPAVPALFTLLQSGVGPAAALHADFGLISEQRPARASDTILLFATGLGAVTPPAVTGRPPAGLTSLTGSLQVTIGGRLARVLFAGLAPNFVGLYQINVDVPAGVPAGQPEVRLVVDGISSAEGVVLAVR